MKLYYRRHVQWNKTQFNRSVTFRGYIQLITMKRNWKNIVKRLNVVTSVIIVFVGFCYSAEKSGPNPANISPTGANALSSYTGAFTYSYPIDIPPARKELFPKMELRYDSQAGNGWLGIGWSLEFGSIQRKTSKGVPAYTDQDVFTANLLGQVQDLLPIGGGEYRSQIESSFMRFKFTNSSEWDAWDKSGKKYIFTGGTTNGTAFYDWNLRSITDTNGNKVLFTPYEEDTSQSPPNITQPQIQYTELNTIGAFQNIINFELEDRPDILTNWRSGVNQQVSKRLKRIVISSGNQLIRKYELAYIATEASESLLASIQVFGFDASNSSWVPSPTLTTFQYSTATPGWQANAQWISPVELSSKNNPNYSLYRGAQLTDVNGDGVADIVQRMSTDNKSYISTSQGFTSSPQWNLPVAIVDRASIDGNSNNDVAVDNGMRFVDLNGDGLVDIVQFQTGVSSWTVNHAWLNTGSGWSDSPQWLLPVAVTHRYSATQATDEGVRFADLNGDGLMDIIQYRAGGTPVTGQWLNTGSGWTSTSQWASPFPIALLFPVGPGAPFSADTGMRFVDLNGDGLVDILQGEVGISFSGFPPNSAYQAWINNGTSWISASQWKPPAEFVSWFSGPKDSGVRMVDINGDGLIDIVGDHGTWLNTRTGWLKNTQWNMPVSMTTAVNQSQDIVSLSTLLQTFSVISGMNMPSTLYGVNSVENGVALCDVNGDQLVDIVQSKGGTVGANSIQTLLNTSPIPNKLTVIRNDLGGNINIGYDSVIPADHLPSPPIIVSRSVNIYDGTTNNISTNYSYQDGRVDKSGAEREFLGFRNVTATDSQGNYTITKFLQNDNPVNGINLFKGRIAEQDSYDAGGNLQKKTVNTYGYTTPFVGVYFPFLSQVNSYIGTKQSQVQYQYDAYGNLKQETYAGDLSTTGDEKTIVTDYSSNTTDYLVGYPIHKKVLSADGTTAEENWMTYDNNTSYTQNPVKGLLTRSESWLSGGGNPIKTFAYNSYGLVTDEYDARWNASAGAQGNHVQRTYDATLHQFPSTVMQGVGSLNLSESFTFDPGTGQMLSHTDANNQITQYQYDIFRRLTKVINPNDTAALPTTTYQYNILSSISSSNLHSMVSSARPVSGSTTTLDTYTFFDGMGRKRETKSPGASGKQIISDIVNFDSRGLVQKSYLPFTAASVSASFVPENTSKPAATMTYDALGRLTSMLHPDGTLTQKTYFDWNEIVTDANGHMKAYAKDAYGRITQIVEQNGGQNIPTLYLYDALGNLTQIVNSLSQSTLLVYDTLSRKTAISDPQMGLWQYQYDANGNLTSQTDARNLTTQLTYDALNRLKTKTYVGGPTLTYQYDTGSFAKGRLNQVTDIAGTQAITYDNLGRSTQKARTMFSNTYTTQMTYDNLGRETSVTYPNNSTVQNTYDGSTFKSVKDSQSGTVYATLTYDDVAVGKLQSVAYGNGVTTSYTYKPNNFYLNTLVSANSSAQTFQYYGYTYDNVGNINGITDPVRGANQAFQYDDLDRLTQATGQYGSKTYQYDSFGNLTLNPEKLQGTWGFETTSDVVPVTGSVYQSDGRMGTGLYFNGLSSAKLVQSEQVSPIQTLSVELWVRPLALGSTGYVLQKQGSFAFPQLNADSSLNAQLTLSSGVKTLRVPNAVSLNIWSHLVLTYDGSYMRVYVNGVQQGQQVSTGTIVPTVNPINIGNSGFNGILDEINVHPRVLSAAEVLARYQSAPVLAPNQPLTPEPMLGGQLSGQLNVSYGFKFAAWDLNGRPVKYRIDWGTGSVTSTSYVPSGTTVISSRSWTQTGTYGIKVQAAVLPAGTTTEIYSPWSPAYNIAIDSAVVAQYSGIPLIGARSGVSATPQTGAQHTVGEWAVGSSTSSLYKVALGYQGPFSGTSSYTAAYLGAQGIGGADATPPTKVSLAAMASLSGSNQTEIDAIAWGLRQNGYAEYKDQNGNLKIGGGRWIQFDWENRPIKIITPDGTVTQFLYDFEGNRVYRGSQVSGQALQYSIFVGQIYEITNARNIQYITAGSLRVASKGSDGELLYYIPDHLGSSNVLMDASQTPVRLTQYTPFGATWQTAGTKNNEYKFTGQRLDDSTGLYYFGARYYDPLSGKFLSIDPELTVSLGKQSTAKPYWLEPRNLNGYVYAWNNPLRRKDPTGRYEIDVHYDLTYFLAVNAGFTNKEAQIIAFADQYVDDNLNTNPFASEWARKNYHFTTIDRRDDMLNKAIDNKSLKQFGQYLHAFEDSFSHQKNGVPYGPPLYHGWTHDPDKTYKRPELADSMALATYNQMRDFLRANDRTPFNIWNDISDKVFDFNRATSRLSKLDILDIRPYHPYYGK